MKIVTYIDLKNFKFWSGAIPTRMLLSDDEMDFIDDILDELYPDGLDETELNDIFWFDDDFIAECLGYKDGNEMWEDRSR